MDQHFCDDPALMVSFEISKDPLVLVIFDICVLTPATTMGEKVTVDVLS